MDEKRVYDPLLEDHDPTAKDSAIESTSHPASKIDSSSFLPEPFRTPKPSSAHRIGALLLLFFGATITYFITFNLTLYLTSSSSSLINDIQSLPTAIPNSLTDIMSTLTSTTDLLLNPPTQEEIIHLLTELYTLLSHMGYYSPSLISHPPHTINSTLAFSLPIPYTARAIDFMNSIPYLNLSSPATNPFSWNYGSYEKEFISGGQFVDLREDETLKFRDPFFQLVFSGEGEGAEYMLGDYVLLSTLAENGLVMILDVSTFKLWSISQYDMEMQNADPVTQDPDPYHQYEWFDTYSLDIFPKRLARNVLREYIDNFKNLKWIPGGLSEGNWEGDEFKRLYVENGWGGEGWDRDGFLKAVEEFKRSEDVRNDMEQPLQYVEWAERSLEWLWKGIRRREGLVEEFDKGTGEGWRIESVEGRAEWRRKMVEEIQTEMARVPEHEEEVERKKEAAKGVEREVVEARTRRVAKYGFP